MAVETTVVTITPEIAETLLAKNDGNRPVRPAAVTRYAHDMKEGHWILNGEAIMISDLGKLVNGQNRLTACVIAQTPFETVLVTGLNGKAMDTIDIGVGRTLADALFWKGIKAPRTVATGITWVWRYDDMVARGLRQLATASYTRQDLLDFFDANPGLQYSALTIEKYRKKLPVSVGVATFTHYLMARTASRSKADQFFSEVAEGSGAEDEPSYMLREWLLDHQTPMARKSPTWVAAMCIKAGRFYLQGLTVKRLSWKRPNQRKGEEFPRIDTTLV